MIISPKRLHHNHDMTWRFNHCYSYHRNATTSQLVEGLIKLDIRDLGFTESLHCQKAQLAIIIIAVTTVTVTTVYKKKIIDHEDLLPVCCKQSLH